MSQEQKTNNSEPSSDRLKWLQLLRGDRVMWTIIGVLMVLSLLVVYSSAAKMGYMPGTGGSTFSFLRKHLFTLIGTTVVMFTTYCMSCRRYHYLSWAAYWGSFILTLLVYVMGSATNSAERWLNLGFFSFQPSELLKIATVMVLARQLSSRQKEIEKLRIIPSIDPRRWFKEREQKRIWREGTLPILGPVILSCGVIFKAHISSAVMVAIISVAMMFVARIRLRELMKMLAIVLSVVALIFTVSNIGRSDTARGRIGTWVDSWMMDTSEKTQDFTDTERAMVAIHDGGLTGLGAGQSVMRPRITHPESDYIFALFVEEYGLLMSLFLIALYVWIFFRAMHIFQRCEWLYAGLLVVGLALLLTVQALLHILVTINILPETGQNLPFITQSTTAMFCAGIAAGMILGISRQIENKTLKAPTNESMIEGRK